MSIKTCISFLIGGAIGSAITFVMCKKYYENVLNEEIESVKETFSHNSFYKDTDANADDSKSTTETNSEHIVEAKNIISNLKYASDNNDEPVEESNEIEKHSMEPIEEDINPNPKNHPYVIHPDEYGEFSSYETISLIYYTDGILADDYDKIVENVNDVVGEESLKHFGEYEDDSVFVRNDTLKCDYEILLSLKTYKETYLNSPHRIAP